jgi:hypothetical protein
MKTCFKEWAAVCRSLARGATALVLRRGGVAERDGAYRAELPEFLLFPTRFHQDPDGVSAAARADLEAARAEEPPPGRLSISHWAACAACLPVAGEPALRALRPFHAWSDAVALERLSRQGDSPLAAMVLRVHALPAPVDLPLREAYGGCRSWIELEEDVPVAGSRPVLSETEFAAILASVRSALSRA